MKRCTGPCGRELEEAEFYVKDKKSGRRFARCKQCHCKQSNNNYHGEKHEDRKAQRREYAKEHHAERVSQMRKWRRENPDKDRKIRKRYEVKHKDDPKRIEKKRRNGARYRQKYADRIAAQNAAYRERNRDILRVRYKAWCCANPEASDIIRQRWRSANRAAINASTHRRRAMLKGCAGKWTGEEWEALKEAQDYVCLWCGEREPDVSLTPDHVKPLSCGGDNTILNLQGLCGLCNSTKNASEIDLRDDGLLGFVAEVARGGIDVCDIEPPENSIKPLDELLPPTEIPIMGNRKQWQHLDADGLRVYAARIVNHYRESGYPHYQYTQEQKRRQIDNLLSYDASVRDTGEQKIVLTGNHALGLCWSYFPHAAGVRCHKRRTPLEVFESGRWFETAVNRRLKRGDYISDSGIRKAVRGASGVQAVSNFRPTAATAIYKHFHRDEKLTVWDMSAGYGGRMLGAWASDVVGHYIGTDPCGPTFDGLCRMRDELADLAMLPPMRVELHRSGSEVFDLLENSVDLCFTSPPYFATENYGNEPEQSHHKFPAYGDWLNGFLKATLLKCRQALKPHGSLALNVANVTGVAPTLEADTVAVAQSCGFRLVETLRLALSHITKGGHKYEPIFVFAQS